MSSYIEKCCGERISLQRVRPTSRGTSRTTTKNFQPLSTCNNHTIVEVDIIIIIIISLIVHSLRQSSVRPSNRFAEQNPTKHTSNTATPTTRSTLFDAFHRYEVQWTHQKENRWEFFLEAGRDAPSRGRLAGFFHLREGIDTTTIAAILAICEPLKFHQESKSAKVNEREWAKDLFWWAKDSNIKKCNTTAIGTGTMRFRRWTRTRPLLCGGYSRCGQRRYYYNYKYIFWYTSFYRHRSNTHRPPTTRTSKKKATFRDH